jgi:hypothetical protein
MVNADQLESAPGSIYAVRLDEERADRRQALDRLAAAQERIAALLTDQRPAAPVAPLAAPEVPQRRSWRFWRR